MEFYLYLERVFVFYREEKFKAQGLNIYSIFNSCYWKLISWNFNALLIGAMNIICIPLMILIILTTLRADILDKKNK